MFGRSTTGGGGDKRTLWQKNYYKNKNRPACVSSHERQHLDTVTKFGLSIKHIQRTEKWHRRDVEHHF